MSRFRMSRARKTGSEDPERSSSPSSEARASQPRAPRSRPAWLHRPRGRRALVLKVAVAGAAVLALIIAVWPDDDTHGGHGGPADNKRASSALPSPSPIYPISSPPRTIPSVREHRPARGPGFRPVDATRVIVDVNSGSLADEGKLFAQELGADYVLGGQPRAGDIELALSPPPAGQKAVPESYTLTTRDRRVRITGADDAGVFYGTRTLKQALKGGGVMPEGVVDDRPDEPQRGLNLDIARKPYTEAWIEDQLRQMADLKLNQLGLHFSDDQGFRIESAGHPEIVSRDHLSKRDVQRIVALATKLHITVIPEVDSPGHLGAVLAAHPDLQLRDKDGKAVKGAIDIANPASGRIVDDLLREYADLFPGTYWHLGGDEYQALAVKSPETSFPGLAAAARDKYGSKADIRDLATGWLNDRAAVLRSANAGRTLKAWNDGFFAGGEVAADQGREVEYWTGKEPDERAPEELLAQSRSLVNLNDEYLYYVLGEPNTFKYPTGKRIYEEWTPLVLRGTKPVDGKYAGQILGGRFAVWSDVPGAQTEEQVARGIRLPLRATAQKLWDARTPAMDWEDFKALADRLG
ncbi:glycoside hydrolase family 20 protein [Streptomyces sp. MBT27]|uniref:beta-N-acetylhexosaminidase n=1 Tax=Streptomyces sp. MBT27 TaxID=1488356 RepID=UPI001F078D4D|nr:glycoside hydrolase family 20 protein [Streptomyces sp. MBT27]